MQVFRVVICTLTYGADELLHPRCSPPSTVCWLRSSKWVAKNVLPWRYDISSLIVRFAPFVVAENLESAKYFSVSRATKNHIRIPCVNFFWCRLWYWVEKSDICKMPKICPAINVLFAHFSRIRRRFKVVVHSSHCESARLSATSDVVFSQPFTWHLFESRVLIWLQPGADIAKRSCNHYSL